MGQHCFSRLWCNPHGNALDLIFWRKSIQPVNITIILLKIYNILWTCQVTEKECRRDRFMGVFIYYLWALLFGALNSLSLGTQCLCTAPDCLWASLTTPKLGFIVWNRVPYFGTFKSYSACFKDFSNPNPNPNSVFPLVICFQS